MIDLNHVFHDTSQYYDFSNSFISCSGIYIRSFSEKRGKFVRNQSIDFIASYRHVGWITSVDVKHSANQRIQPTKNICMDVDRM